MASTYAGRACSRLPQFADNSQELPDWVYASVGEKQSLLLAHSEQSVKWTRITKPDPPALLTPSHADP